MGMGILLIISGGIENIWAKFQLSRNFFRVRANSFFSTGLFMCNEDI